jgi:ubiquinone biosynthesis protein Coq4
MNDVPYLFRGIRQVETTSSVLVSSSKYLNSPEMREWVSTMLLRRNGPDLPTPSDGLKLANVIKSIQNFAEIDAMLEDERRRFPELDRWLSERFVSKFTKEDLAKYPPGSVANLFYRQLADNDYQVNIVPPYEPRGHYEYWLLRSGQTHDFDHILGNGGFDSLGELVPGFMRLEGIYKHFTPELAQELAVMQYFLSIRFLTRTALHYPHAWHVAWDAVERGQRIGRQSGPFFLAKYEDVFHLTPAEARVKLGIEGVVERDTAAASAIWDGRTPPTAKTHAT